MAVYKHREKHVDENGKTRTKETWRYRKQFRIAGRLIKVSGTPKINTKAAAEAAERKAIEEADRPTSPEPIAPQPKEVPTFAKFAITFMATYATTNNKPSEQAAKESILKNHLVPAIGSKRLDQITAADIESLKATLLRTERNPEGVSRKR